MRVLKILTLNVWNRQGPYARRLELIRAGIAELSPDVIGLQEIVVDGDYDQAREIGAGLGYQAAFGVASTYGEGSKFGNAILSRWPIQDVESFALPSEGSEQRALLSARIHASIGELPFFVTHLAWRFEEGHLREAQVRRIAEHVKARTRPDDPPGVLVGDFNAGPDATEIRFVKGLTSLEGKSLWFTDAYEIAGEQPGYTFDAPRNPHAALTHEYPRRIDYVFVRGPDAEGRGKILSSRVVFDEVVTSGTERVAPSDHYGVYTEVAY